MNVERAARSGDRTLDQWFTPFWAAEILVEDVLAGLGAVSIVDAGCGTGAFLAAVPSSCPAVGVDVDPRVVAAARANTGREVLLGDFRDVDLSGRSIEVVLGNPPFKTGVIDDFFERSYQLLPDDGRIAMILPTYVFKSAIRVTRWMDRFSMDVNLIPRNLFPRLSKELVWAKCIKGGQRRFFGLMLFAEQCDVERMRRPIREALVRPGTWREAVRIALEALGGCASLQAIYDMITPERRVSAHWQPKVRQILQLHHQPVERGRWAL